MMPHMSGVDYLTSLDALMSDPSFHSLEKPPAIIVVTSASPEEVPSDNLQRRFRRFVRAVLRKPVDVGALAERVKSLLTA
jgi:CheY-like chemotaxis protein